MTSPVLNLHLSILLNGSVVELLDLVARNGADEQVWRAIRAGGQVELITIRASDCCQRIPTE